MSAMKEKAWQVGKYSGAAFISTVINIVVRALLSHAMNFHLSVFIAYFVGAVINYVLSALFVFSRGDGERHFSWKSFWRFMTVSAFGFFATLIVSALVRLLLLHCFPSGPKHWLELIAHIIGLNASFVCNYFGHSFFSFRKVKPEK